MKNNLSYIEKLIKQADEIQPIVDEMLDNSKIYYHDPNDNNSNTIYLGVDIYHWSKKDEKNQIIAKTKYLEFYDNFSLLLDKANSQIKSKIKSANSEIINIVEQNKALSSIEGGKKYFEKQINIFKSFLKLLSTELSSTLIVPDTNSIIQYPEPRNYNFFSKNNKFTFVILPTVLSELDKHKMSHKNESFRKKVKSVIKRLKGFRNQGDILKGVITNKVITVKMIATEPNFNKTLNWLDPNNNDDRIIANVLELQILNPSEKVIFITSDINLQNKAQLANITVYDTDDLEEE